MLVQGSQVLGFTSSSLDFEALLGVVYEYHVSAQVFGTKPKGTYICV